MRYIVGIVATVLVGRQESAFARFCPACGASSGPAGPGFTRLVPGPA